MKSLPFLLISAFGLLVVAGCESVQNNNSSADIEILMQAESSSVSPAKAAGTANYQNAAHEVVLHEVKLFVEEFELESLRDDDHDFELEDIIVNLPLDGSPYTITKQEVQPGLYEEFELEVERPDNPVSDSDFNDDSGRYSIVVRGTYDGEEFVFRSGQDFELEIELNPPVEVSDDQEFSLTLGVDLSQWFYDSNAGEYLDPRDDANAEMINSAISKSFHMFDDYSDYDDDEDDDDDDDDDSDD